MSRYLIVFLIFLMGVQAAVIHTENFDSITSSELVCWNADHSRGTTSCSIGNTQSYFGLKWADRVRIVKESDMIGSAKPRSGNYCFQQKQNKEDTAGMFTINLLPSPFSYKSGFEDVYVRYWQYWVGEGDTNFDPAGGEKIIRIDSGNTVASGAGNGMVFDAVDLLRDKENDDGRAEGIGFRYNGNPLYAEPWGVTGYSSSYFNNYQKQWQCIIYRIKLNSINPYKADGVSAVYINDNLVGSDTDENFRCLDPDDDDKDGNLECTDFKINTVSIGGWYSNCIRYYNGIPITSHSQCTSLGFKTLDRDGDGVWDDNDCCKCNSHQNNYRYIDDIVIGTALADVACGEAPPSCTNGETRSCSTGKPGICSAGTQTCSNGNWGTCAQNEQPKTEICGNSIDDDCDGTADEGCTCAPNWQCTDWSQGDCGTRTCTDANSCGTNSGKPAESLECTTPACEVTIFSEQLPGTIPSVEPMSVVSNGYIGNGLRIDGTTAWTNARIESMNIDISGVDWANSRLEFYLRSAAYSDYLAVNLFSENGKTAEVAVKASGSGNYELISIPLTEFSGTRPGNTLKTILFGANWQGTQAYIDEIKIKDDCGDTGADSNGDGTVDIYELANYIYSWKTTSSVTMIQLLQAISQWKEVPAPVEPPIEPPSPELLYYEPFSGPNDLRWYNQDHYESIPDFVSSLFDRPSYNGADSSGKYSNIAKDSSNYHSSPSSLRLYSSYEGGTSEVYSTKLDNYNELWISWWERLSSDYAIMEGHKWYLFKLKQDDGDSYLNWQAWNGNEGTRLCSRVFNSGPIACSPQTFAPTTCIDLPSEEWYQYKVHVKLNTPGQNDGFFQVWINREDGQGWQALWDLQNVNNIRCTQEDNIIGLRWGGTRQRSSGASSKGTKWIDDIKIGPTEASVGG